MSYIGQRPDTIVSRNTFSEFNYTATNAQTTFTGADTNGLTLSYNAGNVEVFLNGVRLEEADFTATDGTSVVLASGATTGDLLSVKSAVVFETNDAVSKASGGTFNNSISVTGTVTATSFSGDGSSLSGISTDVVADITPQLGGNLDTNGKNIAFGDSSGSTNNRLTFGSNNEFQIYQNPSLGTYMVENGSGKSMRFMASDFKLQNTAGTHEYIVMTDGGSVAISHGNGKKFETTTTGATVTGTLLADGLDIDNIGINGGTITGQTGSMSLSGNVTVENGDLTIPNKLIHAGDTNTYLQFIDDNINLIAGGYQFLNGTSTSVTLLKDIVGFGKITTDGIGQFNDYIDLNTVGNRGKIGYDSNNVYIGSTASAGQIIFKNGITSTDPPQTSGSELMRIDSSGRVMIGTTTEGVAGADELTVGDTGAGNGITIRSASNSSGALFFSDGTTGGAEYDGGFEYNHSSQFMRIISAESERMRIDNNGNVGIGISPATTAGVNYARLVIDADSSTYPKSLEINATNSAGPNFAISSYSDSNGSYYLMGANLSYQTNGNFAWETNGEHMSGVVVDSRAGHGVTFVDSYYDGSSAYVPAEIGKVHTSLDSRADMIVDASGLAGDGGLNANAFFNAKAKGYYYAGLDIKSNDGHVGGWIGHWNGGSTARNLQARVGGTGINASDYQAIYVDYLGRVTHPNRPHFRVRGFPSHFYVSTIQSAEDGRLRNWNAVDVNRGSHFTNSTGKFTIPVTGDYAFYCTVMYTNPNTMDFHLTFKLNGATLTASNDHNAGGSGQGHQWNGTTLCYSGYFSANDYVGFSITGGGSSSTTYLYQSNTYNVMGGYLL